MRRSGTSSADSAIYGQAAPPPRVASAARALEMFVGGIVVEDDADQLACCDVVLDGIEEADEFAMTVAPHATVDHLTAEHAEAANRVVVPYRLCVMIWQFPGLIGNHGWAVRRPSGRPPALGIHQRLHALISPRDRAHADRESCHLAPLLGRLGMAAGNASERC